MRGGGTAPEIVQQGLKMENPLSSRTCGKEVRRPGQPFMVEAGGDQQHRGTGMEGLEGAEAEMGDQEIVFAKMSGQAGDAPQQGKAAAGPRRGPFGGLFRDSGEGTGRGTGAGVDEGNVETGGRLRRIPKGTEGGGAVPPQAGGILRAEADKNLKGSTSREGPGGKGIRQREQAGIKKVGGATAPWSGEQIDEEVEAVPAGAPFVYADKKGPGGPEAVLRRRGPEAVKDDESPGPGAGVPYYPGGFQFRQQGGQSRGNCGPVKEQEGFPAQGPEIPD
jgi:hypothetical protein